MEVELKSFSVGFSIAWSLSSFASIAFNQTDWGLNLIGVVLALENRLHLEFFVLFAIAFKQSLSIFLLIRRVLFVCFGVSDRPCDSLAVNSLAFLVAFSFSSFALYVYGFCQFNFHLVVCFFFVHLFVRSFVVFFVHAILSLCVFQMIKCLPSDAVLFFFCFASFCLLHHFTHALAVNITMEIKRYEYSEHSYTSC